MTTASLKLEIPSTLKDIPFSRMQKWLDLMLDKEERTDLELTKLAIEVFCGVPGDIILKMDKADVDSIINSILNVIKKQVVPVTVTFKHGGDEYGLIPDFEAMSLGEFVDLTEYIKTPKTQHLALSIMYRKITYKKYVAGMLKYDIEDYEKTHDRFSTLNSHVAIGATFFLTSSIMELEKHSYLYLEELKETDPKLSAHLLESMGGSTVSTD